MVPSAIGAPVKDKKKAKGKGHASKAHGKPKAPAKPVKHDPYLPGGIRIAHEDADVIVIDKPAGMLTATLPGEDRECVFGAIKRHVREQARRRGTRVWIIHRLDKEASGLLVFAKSERAFEHLKEEFRAKRVHRLYAAVLEGELRQAPAGTGEAFAGGTSAPGERPSGVIQSFLAEGHDGIMRSVSGPARAGRADDEDERTPKLAITHWRVQDVGAGRTMVSVKLDTGRKNQIRAHMKELGFPIVGDRRYGAATDPIGRLCLHGYELGFSHPATGQALSLRSPTPPQFFRLVGSRAMAEESRDQSPSPAIAPAAGARSSWDHVADWYDELLEDRGSDHHERIILPGTIRLLGNVAGEKVLDIACGQGVLCRRLAELGAEVTGVDAAPRLIDAANRLNERITTANKPRYFVGDARELGSPGIGDGYDGATCIMALMNIDPLSPLFEGVNAALRPGGTLVAVLLHPAFRAPGQTSWGWDEGATKAERGQRQYRRVEGYLSPGASEIVMNPGAVARGRPAITTTTHHRPIQAYVRALAEAGLLIDALEEWPSLRVSQPGPRADEENRLRREIPMFLAIRARKPHEGGAGSKH